MTTADTIAIQEGWQPARLIPTIGIKGQEEQEKRATSCLLAVMGAVSEFGRELLSELDAPAGRLSTFTEVQLKDGDGRLSIPDGALVVQRGKTTWRALVEVKTGTAQLNPEQVGRYLDLAREQGFDCVVTISNQITGSPNESPVTVDGRKLRRVALRHLSWWQIITAAHVQSRFRGISDPDQAWILGELIAYLDSEASGASGFHDMGPDWVKVRDGARQQALRPGDPEVRDVAGRWDQFIQYLCLGLGQDLGRDVRPARARKPVSVAERHDALAKELAATGKLAATIRVPDAVGPITIEADLRARLVTTSVSVDAPRNGSRPLTNVKWLLRQLNGAPDPVLVCVSFVNAKETVALSLPEAREFPQRLLSSADVKRAPRTFRLAVSRPLGTKRGKGQGSFVRETRQQTVDFYRELVQQLRPWQPAAPKLPPDEPESIPMTPQPELPPFSSSEQREAGEAADPSADGPSLEISQPAV